MLSPDWAVARTLDGLTDTIATALEGLSRPLLRFGRRDVRTAIEELLALYPERPVRDNKGGQQLDGSLLVFAIARLLRPRLIVESGVWKGHTTWLLRQAAPKAEIHAFDLSFEQREWLDPETRYHQRDWSEVALAAPEGSAALCFFDDHVSQARRLAEAHARGFRVLLLDDNLPAHQLYLTGVPPVPTLDMLRDPAVGYGENFAWLRNGKPRRYLHTREEESGATALVADYRPLPDLHFLTRRPPHRCLTFVTLAERPAPGGVA